MGSLYWQLNDCWPVASWASIDYYGRWKALQFYAKKFYADLTIAPTSMMACWIQPSCLTSATRHCKACDHTHGFDGAIYSRSEQEYLVPPAATKQVSHLVIANLLGQHAASETLALLTLTVDGQRVPIAPCTSTT